MGRSVVTLALIALLVVGGCGGGDPKKEATKGVVPNVVGQDHQSAQDTMQAAGFRNLDEEDASGHGRHLIVDRNWKVCSQTPPGGTQEAAGARILLRSVKDEEECPSPNNLLAETSTTAAATTTAPITAAPTTGTVATTVPTVTAPPRAAAPTTSPPTAAPTTAVYYGSCAEAKAAGAAPLHQGDPGYRLGLDRDRDGVACEK